MSLHDENAYLEDPFMKPLYLTTLIAMSFLKDLSGQVINIENRRLHTDSVRLAGNLNIAFLLNSTNGKNIATFRGNGILQFKSKDYDHLWLLTANYDLAKAEKQDFVNSFYIHGRYNYKLTKWLRWEAFVQHQINEPLGIASRKIVGTGPRFKVRIGKDADIYIASAYMYEDEKTTSPASLVLKDGRSSNYISLNIRFPKVKGSLISTSYYQPLYRDLSDHRIMNDTRLSFRVAEKIQVYTNFSCFFDSKPPPGIRKSTLNLEQGFGFSF